MNALQIRNLSKTLGGFKLDRVNIELPAGYIMGYIGRNGAGKTTTIKLIMEQLKKDSGEISVFGRNFTGDEIAYKSMIGYIADECYFPGYYTVKDTVKVLNMFYPTFSETRFRSFLNRWELPEKKKIRDFSKGMKMKLMFAAVLSRETRLLILDEPTSGLDPVIRVQILEILQDYIVDGRKSVLFSTHIMSDLEKIADFICFIDEGKIVFSDTRDNLTDCFYLIKGGINQIPDSLKDKMIGLKKTGVGFEGLIYRRDKGAAEPGLILEQPSIEDIVVHYINGKSKGVGI